MTVAAHTTLELAGPAVVVVKHRAPLEPQLGGRCDGAGLGAARQQTEAEGRWLAAARHPGVVRLRLVSAARCRIETHHAGLATMRTWPLPPERAAPALAAVAATLGELHGRGLVHGNLAPDHVILPGWPARPLLCSPSGTAHDPADDISGLAALAAQVASSWGRPGPAWTEVIDRLHRKRDRIGAGRAAGLLAGLAHRSCWGLPTRHSRRRPGGPRRSAGPERSGRSVSSGRLGQAEV